MSVIGNPQAGSVSKASIEAWATMPGTYQSDFIFLAAGGSICQWVSTVNYTGYQSLNCGGLLLLTSEQEVPSNAILAMGQEVSKADNLALYSKLVREGRLVTSGAWTKGSLQIHDMTASTFRMPDLRDSFPRFYGTGRASGSYQTDAIRNIVGTAQIRSGGSGVLGSVIQGTGALSVTVNGGASTVAAMQLTANAQADSILFSAANSLPAGRTTDPTNGENRPINTAFVPAILK